MSEPLPNRSEALPEKRYYDPSTDDNWADILHDVLKELSVNALVSGTHHTDFEPAAGQLFVPTNGGSWYLGDGDTWNEVATSGSGGATLGGEYSTTGDGTTTTFEWSTGVTDPADLEYATIDASSAAASTDFETFINGTNIGVKYARAPADGAALSWFWSVNTTVADSHTHEGDDIIPASVDTPDVRTDRLQDGTNPADTISRTGASLSFTGDGSRDIHDATDVSLSNSSGASVTENVTVDYYQGIDNTGTLLESETQSVTLANGASTTATYLTADFELDNVDYYIEVTATDLTADGIDEHTLGAEYVVEQTSTGDLVTTDQNGRERKRYDVTSGTVSYPSVKADKIQTARVLSQTGDEFIRFAPDYADSGSGTSADPYVNGVANAKADLAGPGVIIIPANTYCQEDDIAITNSEHVSIWGAGRGQSFIVESGNSTNQTISVSADQSGSNHREFATLRGFSLLGRNNGTGIDGLNVTGDRHLFEDLHIATYVDNGIKLSPSNVHNTFRNVYCHNNGKHGMRVNHCSVGHFENCSFRLNAAQGVWNAGGMANMLFDSCAFESNARSGLFSNNTGTKWKFLNCFFEGNNTGAFGSPDVDIQNTALENIKIIFETCGFSATGDAPVALSLDYQENVDIRFCHFPASGSGKDALTITNSKRIRTVGSEIPSPINDTSNVLIDGNLATIGATNDPTTTDYDVTQLRNGTIITDDGTNAWVVVDETVSDGALAI